jgi:hypothetical protein
MSDSHDHRPMWAELGLDLDKHDALLAALGQTYRELFLGQKNRPDGMGYFDFVMSEVHGLRITQNLVADGGDTVEQLIDRLVDRYFAIDCAVFTPDPTRAPHALEIARAAGADGAIHYALQFCQPYQIEAPALERALEQGGLPTLRIDTDHGQEDAPQLATRVEAFLEQLRGRPAPGAAAGGTR